MTNHPTSRMDNPARVWISSVRIPLKHRSISHRTKIEFFKKSLTPQYNLTRTSLICCRDVLLLVGRRLLSQRLLQGAYTHISHTHQHTHFYHRKSLALQSHARVSIWAFFLPASVCTYAVRIVGASLMLLARDGVYFRWLWKLGDHAGGCNFGWGMCREWEVMGVMRECSP